MQPTGYCQFSKCRKPLYNGLKYCNALCGKSARMQKYRNRRNDKPAPAPACYGVDIKSRNLKRWADFKANKKHVWGAKLTIPRASFPGR